jgi:hypothetical protein
LEKPPSYSSRTLFENTGSTPVYEAVLDGQDTVTSRNESMPLSRSIDGG